MLIKMKRSQRTELGMLRAGVAYNIDENTHGTLLNRLLKDKKFAVKTTKKQLSKDAETFAAQEAAQMAASEDGAAQPEMIRQAAVDKAVAEKSAAQTAVDVAQVTLDATKPDTDDHTAAQTALADTQAALAEIEG